MPRKHVVVSLPGIDGPARAHLFGTINNASGNICVTRLSTYSGGRDPAPIAAAT